MLPARHDASVDDKMFFRCSRCKFCRCIKSFHMAEAVICASCPERFHDEVADLCLKHKIQKAFGKAGDMVNALSGKDWIPKWEAKVVMATVTKAQTLSTNKALILCIAGGKNCDAEMARQPALVRAIKTEMNGQDFRVRVEWIEIEEFLERYPAPSSPSKPKGKDSKGGEEGKHAKNGKGDDKVANSKQSSNHDGKENGKGKGKTKENSKTEPSEPTKTCKYWLEGNCKNGSNCKFLHTKEGRQADGYPKGRNHDSNPKESTSKTCKYWLEGNCKNGSNCKFLHANGASAADAKVEKGSNSAKGPSKTSPGKEVAKEASKPKEAKKDDKKKLQCLVCKQKFKDWQTMCSKHFLCQGCPPLCLCVECNKTFEDEVACAQHQSAKGHKGMARVNDEAEPLFACGCGKEFDSQRAKEQHQDSLGHGDFPACLSCMKSFPDLEALAQHQRAKGHSGWGWVNDDSDLEAETLGPGFRHAADQAIPKDKDQVPSGGFIGDLTQLTGPDGRVFWRMACSCGQHFTHQIMEEAWRAQIRHRQEHACK